MLEVKNLTILIGTRVLIDSLSFVVNMNEKMAIIGEEGDGKSTLLKCIANKCNYVNVYGSINLNNNRIGYLPQSMSDEDINKSAYDYLFLDDNEYYNNANEFYKIIRELNINEDVLNKDVCYLSGGEKVKLQIIKLLLDKNDILLLDEPTNDIDLETLKWLESFINSCKKPIVYVSHDEMFLSSTANSILHLEQVKRKKECKHTFLRITYNEYIEKRLSSINHQTQVAKSEARQYKKREEKLNQIMSKVEHQQNTISRSDPHGAKVLKKKMHSLKAQEHRMQNTELTDVPDVEESINFHFEKVNIPRAKEVLKLSIKELTINDKLLSSDINLNIIGPERIVIVGNNGVGKTTLLKEILKLLHSKKDLKIGYMPQNYDDILSKYKTPIEFLCDYSTERNLVTKVRTYLGNMKFTSEEMIADINLLSGGSKTKLFLLKLVLDESEVLILDEPTRNVSPLSNPIIRETLANYTGVIISISHDRKYIDEVVDKVYYLTEKGMKEVNKKDII